MIPLAQMDELLKSIYLHGLWDADADWINDTTYRKYTGIPRVYMDPYFIMDEGL